MWYYIFDGIYSSIYLIGVNIVEDVIYIPLEDVEVIEGYKENISDHFEEIPDIADSILRGVKQAFPKI